MKGPGRVAAFVWLVLAWLAPSPVAAAPAGAQPESALACATSRPDSVPFRLGTSAGPYGASSAVADLNADGRPDLAVADRVGRGAGTTRYRLQIAVAGLDAVDVAFESADDALVISVADVDHDSDLDIVASRPLSGETVAVWLNDGRGRFTSADVGRLPKTLLPDQAIDGRSHVDTLSESVSPRRFSPAPPVSVPASVAGERVSTVRPSSQHHRPAILCSAAAPRAPPSHPDLLS